MSGSRGASAPVEGQARAPVRDGGAVTPDDGDAWLSRVLGHRWTWRIDHVEPPLIFIDVTYVLGGGLLGALPVLPLSARDCVACGEWSASPIGALGGLSTRCSRALPSPRPRSRRRTGRARELGNGWRGARKSAVERRGR